MKIDSMWSFSFILKNKINSTTNEITCRHCTESQKKSNPFHDFIAFENVTV